MGVQKSTFGLLASLEAVNPNEVLRALCPVGHFAAVPRGQAVLPDVEFWEGGFLQRADR